MITSIASAEVLYKHVKEDSPIPHTRYNGKSVLSSFCSLFYGYTIRILLFLFPIVFPLLLRLPKNKKVKIHSDSFVIVLAPFEVSQYGASMLCSGFTMADNKLEEKKLFPWNLI